jgi:hypothetical protein
MRVRDHQWDGIWVRWPHSAMLSPAVPCVGGEGRGAGVPGIGGGWRRQASRHSSGMNVLVRGAATQGRTPAHSLSAAVVTAHAETFRSRHPGTCHGCLQVCFNQLRATLGGATYASSIFSRAVAGLSVSMQVPRMACSWAIKQGPRQVNEVRQTRGLFGRLGTECRRTFTSLGPRESLASEKKEGDFFTVSPTHPTRARPLVREQSGHGRCGCTCSARAGQRPNVRQFQCTRQAQETARQSKR